MQSTTRLCYEIAGLIVNSGDMMKKSKEGINAFLGEDTEFEGKFSFSGAVRIDGKFFGEIFSGGTLIIGENAVIKAQIHVGNLVVSGEIHGNVFADNRIEINVPGKLFGNIQAPRLFIEEGVIFEGNCKMTKLEEETEKDFAFASRRTEAISVLK